jgi:dipeptidyl aminopeptidase/acylaminoacyl peptidase
MNENRDLLTRMVGLFPPPERSLERVHRQQKIRLRNRRLGAGALAFAIVAAATLAGFSITRSTTEPQPRSPSPAPAVAAHSEVSFVDVRTGRERPLPSALTAFADAADYRLSPDGSMVLFEAVGEMPGDDRSRELLVVASTDGSDPQPLIHEPVAASQGRWSPDGTTIVFLSGLGRSATLKVVDVETGAEVRVEGVPNGVWQPSFSPDGRSILFSMATRNPRGGFRVDLWTVPATGGTPTRLIQHGGYGSYSPDGGTIAYHRTGPQPNAFCGYCWWVETKLVFAAADGSERLGMAPGGMVAPPEVFEASVARWSPDGSMVLHTGPTNVGSPAEIVVRDMRRGEIYRIGSGVSPTWYDERTLIVTDFRGA